VGARGNVVGWRHYATNRKVADSIPDEVIGFFNLPNSSSRTVALASAQPLTEMSTRNLPGEGGEGRPARKADNLIAICWPIFYKICEPQRLINLRASMACFVDSFICLPYVYTAEFYSSVAGYMYSVIIRIFLKTHLMMTYLVRNKLWVN
jgi:hypothetical protein